MRIEIAVPGIYADPETGRKRAACRELWDPANAWPAARKWIWALLAMFLVIAEGRAFLNQLRVTQNTGNDYFQDWSSARNVFEGRPAYLPLSESVSRHFAGVDGRLAPTAVLPWNAHPPTSVLATLPLALFDYPLAGTLWNVLSLIALIASLSLIARELKIATPAWSVLPLIALGLICSPIRTQIAQGQWNAQLLLLFTLSWSAARRGRDSWAGFWVGAAATLKLLPIFFLVYFATQRRWRALITGCLTVITVSLITTAVVGLEGYRVYYSRVLPTLDVFRSSWDNASILAFWTKNFADGASHYGLYAEPVSNAPVLAHIGIFLSYAAVLATTFFFVNKSRSDLDKKSRYRDLCYSLTMVTMLLVAPVCWDHYFLLLALPLALIWVSLGQSNIQRLAFPLLVTVVSVGPYALWLAGGFDLHGWPDFQQAPPSTYRIHRTLFVPVFLSLHFYALVASYLWLVILARNEFVAARLMSMSTAGGTTT